jgi:hypothetical protein
MQFDGLDTGFRRYDDLAGGFDGDMGKKPI